MSEPTGMTAGSDFMGIVLMSTVAAIDGCPWVQKDKTVEIAEAVAEMVADAVAEVDSFILPNGEHWRREQTMSDCTNAVHSHPLPSQFLDASHESDARLHSGWSSVQCPDCLLWGWARPALPISELVQKIEQIRRRWTDNGVLAREGFPERLMAYEHVTFLLAEVDRTRGREALEPVRELHRYEFIRMKNDSLERCAGCHDYWPCATARLIYTSEELGEQR